MNSQASETNQQGGHLTTLVERAEPYAALLRRAHLLAEPEAPTELRLQALWQSPTRPKDLALPDGTPVEVLDPGHWNRTAGPDFRDALLSIGGALRRGDVELHLRPVDWDVHGHAADPAYAGVILHVTWMPGPPAKTLPAAVPTLALAPFAERQGKTIDFTALPTPQEDNVDPRPCRLRLEGDPGGLDRLLVSAGAYRLLVKSRAFSEAPRAGDPFQAFYEALLGAMGYRRALSASGAGDSLCAIATTSLLAALRHPRRRLRFTERRTSRPLGPLVGQRFSPIVSPLRMGLPRASSAKPSLPSPGWCRRRAPSHRPTARPFAGKPAGSTR